MARIDELRERYEPGKYLHMFLALSSVFFSFSLRAYCVRISEHKEFQYMHLFHYIIHPIVLWQPMAPPSLSA